MSPRLIKTSTVRILAIETSCDETAIALVDAAKNARSLDIISNLVSSQVALHARWGGVVPNLAKREHQKALVPVFLQALKEIERIDLRFKKYDLRKKQTEKNLKSILEREPELLIQFEKYIIPLKKPKIDIVAVTQGPGLEPALWVGVNFARALSCLWNIPLIGINHMEGHILSALIEQKGISNSKLQISPPEADPPPASKQKLLTTHYSLQTISYPALALLVSGGHTELVLIKKPLRYEIIGETRDDAAGEAFDKVARILGLGYPGGPAISREAEKWKSQITKQKSHTNPKLKIQNTRYEMRLPRPMIHSKDFDFSFSGLKTAVLYLVRDLEKQGIHIKKLRPIIAKEFQDAVVDVLVAKTIRAAKQHKAKTILLGGGVAANTELRKRLAEEIKNKLPVTSYQLPAPELTGDNALMIVAASIAHMRHAKKTTWKTLKPNSTMRLP